MSTPRVPAGSPTGGQFATTGRAEPLFTLETGDEPHVPVVLHPVGFNDEQTQCDRCGRVELRGTVILADDDGNEVSRMGTSCASKALGVKVTRDVAVRKESVRRSHVMVELRETRDLIEQGRFAYAAQRLADARRQGLHRTDEVQWAGQFAHAIDTGLAARADRWGVISRPGRPAVEVDTLAEAQAAADLYAHFGGQVVRLAPAGGWVAAA